MRRLRKDTAKSGRKEKMRKQVVKKNIRMKENMKQKTKMKEGEKEK